MLVLLDSLATYFLASVAGIGFPVNAILPGLILVMVARHGVSKMLPDTSTSIWVVLAIAGFSLGIAFNEELGIDRFLKIGSAFSAFIIGYNVGYWGRNDKKLADYLLLVGLVYSLVCVLALLKIAPGLFPIKEAMGFKEGNLVVRPEITIDQNFQIYYLFFICFIFTQSFSTIRYGLAGLALLGALFTVVTLQTRSGTILLGLSFGLAVIYPVWMKSKGSVFRLLLVFTAFVLIVAIKLDDIQDIASGILDRFFNDDFHTFWGRVISATYLFEKIVNPVWWFPRGNSEFIALYKDVPHFNPTAVFLEGGIIALAAWVALVLLPLFKGVAAVLKKKTDVFEALIVVGAGITFVAGLTLNTPYYEHAWLWAGALLGGLIKKKNSRRAALIHKRAQLRGEQ